LWINKYQVKFYCEENISAVELKKKILKIFSSKFLKFQIFWEFWYISNFGENFICGKIFPENYQKRTNLGKMLEIFTKIPRKSNFILAKYAKICSTLVELILLWIFWIAKEISICSKVCNLENTQNHIFPFPIDKSSL